MTDLDRLRSRRQFLTRSIVLGATAMAFATRSNPILAATGFLLPQSYADASTAAAFWAQPRTLNLYRPATGEHRQLCYWRDGRIEMDGYLAICRMLRDTHEDRAATIDVRLLNLLRGMTAWLAAAYGISEPYQVNSGFRTLTTNAATEGAARNSFHTKGMAVDGIVPGLSPEYLGRLIATFRAGGVGFYINKQHFVHSDVGRVRFWVR
ncbi:MAG: DUF882 domain-containing protein [Burkholderiaceae bacterium]|nr:MAG: DUF882 domain-containing protein [Burkholderiaceae bacterium]